MRPGDVIVSLDNQATPDAATFLTLLWSHDVEDEVEVEYVRGDDTRTATVEPSREDASRAYAIGAGLGMPAPVLVR